MANETSPTIAFPLRDDPKAQRTLKNTLSQREAVRSRLLLLFTTQIGEIWYNPLFGSSIRDHLFNPNDTVEVSDLTNVIQAEVKRWLPGLIIQKVEANQATKSRIELRITFLITNENISDQLEFAISA